MKGFKNCNYVILSMLIALPYANATTDMKDRSKEVQSEQIQRRDMQDRSRFNDKENPEVSRSQERYFSSSNIRLLQTELKNKGYINGVSGVLDSQTREALKKYQKDKSLTVTGQFDQATLRSLDVDGIDPQTQKFSE